MSAPNSVTEAAMEDKVGPSLAAETPDDDGQNLTTTSPLVDCSNSVHSTTNSVDSGIVLNEDAMNSDDLADEYQTKEKRNEKKDVNDDDAGKYDADDLQTATKPDIFYQFHILPHHIQKTSKGGVIFKCEVCSATYRHRFSLKRHFLRTHINCRFVSEIDSTNCSINQKKHNLDANIAEVCAKKTSSDKLALDAKEESPSELNNENLSANNDILDTSALPSIGKTRPPLASMNSNETDIMKGLYWCAVCSLLFDEIDELKIHHQEHFDPKVRKSYTCLKCNMKFSQNDNYTRHLASHSVTYNHDSKNDASLSIVKNTSVHETENNNGIGDNTPSEQPAINDTNLNFDTNSSSADKASFIGNCRQSEQNFYDSFNSDSDSDDTDEKMTEKERLIIQHKQSSEGKHHRWRRGFAFACTICKKRFRDYARMCAHRRLAHQRHLIQRRRFQYKRKPVVEMDPRERQKLELFYANVIKNAADNLRSFIDGNELSLVNPSRFYRVIHEHDFTCVLKDAEFWKQFNFGSDYPQVIWRHLCQIDEYKAKQLLTLSNCDMKIKTEPADSEPEVDNATSLDNQNASVKSECVIKKQENADCEHSGDVTNEKNCISDDISTSSPVIKDEIVESVESIEVKSSPTNPFVKCEVEDFVQDEKDCDTLTEGTCEKTNSVEKMWIDNIHVSDISDDEDDHSGAEVHISDVSLEYISTVNQLSANLVNNQFIASKTADRFRNAFSLSPVKSSYYNSAPPDISNSKYSSTYYATSGKRVNLNSNLALSDISDEDDDDNDCNRRPTNRKSHTQNVDTDSDQKPPKLEIQVSDISSDDDEYVDLDDKPPPYLTQYPSTFGFMTHPTAMKTILDYSLNPMRNIYQMSEFADYPKHDFNSLPSMHKTMNDIKSVSPYDDRFRSVLRPSTADLSRNSIDSKFATSPSNRHGRDFRLKSSSPITEMSNTPISELSFNIDEDEDDDDNEGDNEDDSDEVNSDDDHVVSNANKADSNTLSVTDTQTDCDNVIESELSTSSSLKEIKVSDELATQNEPSQSPKCAHLAYFDLCPTDKLPPERTKTNNDIENIALFNSNPLLPYVSQNLKKVSVNEVKTDVNDSQQTLDGNKESDNVSTSDQFTAEENKPTNELPPIRYMYDDYDIKISFMCLVCKEKFTNSWDLSNHQMDSHEIIDSRHIQMESDCSTDLPSFIMPLPSLDGTLDGLGKLFPENVYSECLNCTKCRQTFKTVDDLHSHIMYCATGLKSKSSSRSYYRQGKGYKRGRNKLGRRTRQGPKMKKPTPVKSDSAGSGRKRGQLAVLRLGDSESAKRDLNDVLNGEGKRRRHRNQDPNHIPYNPKRHVRRRELRQCIDMQTCWGCGKKFANLQLLERHSKKCDQRDVIQKRKLSRQDDQLNPISTAGTLDIPPVNLPLKKTSSVPLQCPYCSKNFIYRTHLRTHLREICAIKQDLLSKDRLSADHMATENNLLKSIFNNENGGEPKEMSVKQAEKVMEQGRQKRLLWMRGNKRKGTSTKRTKSWTSLKHLKSRKPTKKLNVKTSLSSPTKFGVDDIYAYPESTDGEETMPVLVPLVETPTTANSMSKCTPRRKALEDNDPYYMKTIDQQEGADGAGNKRRRKRTFKALILDNGMYPEIDGRKCRAVTNKRKRTESAPEPVKIENNSEKPKVENVQKPPREPVEDDPEKYVYSLPDEKGVVKVWKRRGPKPKWLKAMEADNSSEGKSNEMVGEVKQPTKNGPVAVNDVNKPVKAKTKRRMKTKSKSEADGKSMVESLPLKPTSLKLKMKRKNSKSKWSRSTAEEVLESKVEESQVDTVVNSETSEKVNEPKKKLKLKITKNSDGKMSASVDEANKVINGNAVDEVQKKKKKRMSQKNLDGLYNLMKEFEIQEIEKRYEEIVLRSEKAGPKPVWMRKLINIYTARGKSGNDPNPADKPDLLKLVEAHCAELLRKQKIVRRKRKPKVKVNLKDIANAAQCTVTDQANRLKELAKAAKVAVTEKIQMNQNESVALEADLDLSAPLVIDLPETTDVVKVPRKKRIPKKLLDNADDKTKKTVDSVDASDPTVKIRKKPGPKPGYKRVKKVVESTPDIDKNVVNDLNIVDKPPVKTRRKPGPKPGYKRKKKTPENVENVSDIIPSESGDFIVKDIYDFEDESCLRSFVPSVGVVSPLKLKPSKFNNMKEDNNDMSDSADESALVIDESKNFDDDNDDVFMQTNQLIAS